MWANRVDNEFVGNSAEPGLGFAAVNFAVARTKCAGADKVPEAADVFAKAEIIRQSGHNCKRYYSIKAVEIPSLCRVKHGG